PVDTSMPFIIGVLSTDNCGGGIQRKQLSGGVGSRNNGIQLLFELFYSPRFDNGQFQPRFPNNSRPPWFIQKQESIKCAPSRRVIFVTANFGFSVFCRQTVQDN